MGIDCISTLAFSKTDGLMAVAFTMNGVLETCVVLSRSGEGRRGAAEIRCGETLLLEGTRHGGICVFWLIVEYQGRDASIRNVSWHRMGCVNCMQTWKSLRL